MKYEIVLEVVAGSNLYGTATEDSDKDFRGICIPTYETLIDPFSNFEQHIETSVNDRVIYSLKKFFQLACDSNPNIIELLFVDPEKCIICKDTGKKILGLSDYFLSNKVKKTFAGYAIQQLKRIKLHREWLFNPPKEYPLRENFNLPLTPKYSYDKLESLIHSPIEAIKDVEREYALNEIRYKSAKTYYDSYQNWLKTRNPKRAELELKYGYDTKHAMHLVRLIMEAKELLDTGHIKFPLSCRDFLLDIKNGSFTYEELQDSFGFSEDVIYFSFQEMNSVLPEEPGIEILKSAYKEILDYAYFGNRGNE